MTGLNCVRAESDDRLGATSVEHTPDPSNEPLVSEFADDPDMAELVEMFVSDLPERIGTLKTAQETRDVDALTTIAHQLKGAAPGYGFAPIGDAAKAVEDALRAEGEQAIDGLRDQVDALLNLCERAMSSG